MKKQLQLTALIFAAFALQTHAQVFECTFDSQSDFDRFAVIDANHDAFQSSYFKWGTWDYMFRDATSSPYGDDFPTQCAAYTNSEDNDGDDWLITPAITLKGGTLYNLKYKVRAHRESNTERMEVKLGRSQNATSMTTVIAEATDFNNTTYEEQTHTFRPVADGTYYIGFHALSSTDDMILYLDDISLEASGGSAVPDSVQGLTVLPDSTGVVNDTLRFKLPTTTTSGSALTSIDGVKILRNSTQIADLTNFQAGKEVSYIDLGAASSPGYISYTVIPYNAEGDGRRATAQKWVGLDSPKQPDTVKVTSAANGIAVSWTPSKPVHDGVLLSDNVKYDISLMQDETTPYRKVKSVTGQNSTLVTADTESGDQGKLLIGVAASNSTGSSNYAVGNGIIFGSPYTCPFHETFPSRGNVYGFWEFGGNGIGYTNSFASAGTTKEDDANGDGGAVELQTYYNDSLAVVSGKISLNGTTAPKVAFSQKTSSSTGSVQTFVIKPDGSVVSLSTENLADNAEPGKWLMRSFDLSPFISERYIRIGIAFNQKDVAYKQNSLFLDNIFVGDLPQTDFAVKLSAPRKIRKGTDAIIKATVDNYGQSASNFRLLLKSDERIIVDTTLVEAIPAFDYKTLTFKYTPDKLSTDSTVEFKATVLAEGDNNGSNNDDLVAVELTNADVPGIVSASAESSDESSVNVTWIPENRYNEKTEDFEGYEPWDISNIGDWTLIDADSGRTAGYFDTQRVYYDNEQTPFAYIVWTPTNYGGYDITEANPSAKPYGGTNALASVYSYRKVEDTGELIPLDADNWLISPELTGQAQTISLHVNNYDSSHPETYEVLYSVSGKQQSDFKLLKSNNVSDAAWDYVSFKLPEGSRYFAIRHTTKVLKNLNGIGYLSSPYLFLVDDITYEPLSLVFDHYNVYRDGQLIGTSSGYSYIDNAPIADGVSHKYQVTAVYADGTESAPAIAAVSIANGIKTIKTEGKSSSSWYTIDGRKVMSTQNLPKGLYIIDGKKSLVR